MDDFRFKLLTNRYTGKSKGELKKIYEKKRHRYDRMMKVIKPVSCGMDFLYSNETPLWVKIAHMDEFLECPLCLEEYERKLSKMN